MAQADTREVSIKTPLGADKLLFRRMVATEQLGRPYTYELELLSADENVKVEDLLGENVTIRLALADDSERYWNGVVTRFAQVGRLGGYAVFHATLRPWFWLLTRTTDCRIYKGTVLDILKKAFVGHDFVDYDDSNLDKGAYVDREFSVQYRETTFDFVSRLLEQEGIYYWFKHADGKTTMMLADGPGGHETAPGCDEILYYPPSENAIREKETIREWSFSKEIQPGKYVLDDYDFEDPKADLLVDAKIEKKHKNAALEVYDYPGEYVDPAKAGKGYVQRRMEELSAQHHRAQGEGDVRGLHVGGLFTLAGHPRDDQNKEYLVVSAIHELRAPDYEGFGEHQGGETYSVGFEALDGAETFRSPRITPLPVIRGPQTAVVVGKDGEEIWTDAYGRIKVQFHWDRYGQQDENSSCWIRVATSWAGKNWGAIHIPRIGQEVIVEFLEGDPDRPIVTGSVYNADQMPPYALSDNQTQSGIKSRSSKGGSSDNFNEIRFEDKKGEEELYIHAEKNHTNITENDRSEDVGHDRSLHVGNDKSEAIDNNKSITVGVDHTESIGANKTLSVGANHDESIGANKTLAVGANHDESIGANMTINVGASLVENVAIAYAENVGAAMALNVGAALAIDVGAAMATNVGAMQSTNVGSDSSESVGGKKTVAVDKDLTETVQGAHKEDVTKEYELSAKKVKITAQDEIVLVTGSSKLTMKKDGTVKLEGMKISVEGTQKIEQKAMEIKSEAQMKNETKGAMVTVEASGINTIKGALVKIN